MNSINDEVFSFGSSELNESDDSFENINENSFSINDFNSDQNTSIFNSKNVFDDEVLVNPFDLNNIGDSSDFVENKNDPSKIEIPPYQNIFATSNIDESTESSSENTMEENDPSKIEIPPYQNIFATSKIDESTESSDEDNELHNSVPEIVKLEDSEPEIEISDTPIEDINKLTEYEDDYIESTDIDSIFDKINLNVKEASEIFKKNTEMKKKLDSRFKDLKQLQSEIEIKRKNQMDEISAYRDEVFNTLNDKKEEIEKRLNLLKDEQAKFLKEKEEFEQYKKSENENIEKIKNDVQLAYDERREELANVEDALRKQKEILDEERNQISLDRIQYESDKNELANNLLKFNELVDQFTNGVKMSSDE